MMTMLNFIAGDIVPAEPGDYLVITQDMLYHHCTAEFEEDEFRRFVGRSRETIANLDVLGHAKISSAATVIQGLYPAPQGPATASAQGEKASG